MNENNLQQPGQLNSAMPTGAVVPQQANNAVQQANYGMAVPANSFGFAVNIDTTEQRLGEFRHMLNNVAVSANSITPTDIPASIAIQIDALLGVQGEEDFKSYHSKIVEGAKQIIYDGLLAKLNVLSLVKDVTNFFSIMSCQLLRIDTEDRVQQLWDIQRDKSTGDYKLSVLSLKSIKSKSDFVLIGNYKAGRTIFSAQCTPLHCSRLPHHCLA